MNREEVYASIDPVIRAKLEESDMPLEVAQLELIASNLPSERRADLFRIAGVLYSRGLEDSKSLMDNADKISGVSQYLDRRAQEESRGQIK